MVVVVVVASAVDLELGRLYRDTVVQSFRVGMLPTNSHVGNTGVLKAPGIHVQCM